MKNIKIYILALVIAFASSLSFAMANTVEKACTEEYAPVCADLQVQCVKAPCPPIKTTFWNKCQMLANSSATFIHEWECKEIINKDVIKETKETDFYIVSIDLPLTKNKKIDEKIYDNVKTYTSNFIKDVPSEKSLNGAKYEMKIDWEYKKVGGVYTYKLSVYSYALGAHGNTELKTYNFLRNWKKIELNNKKIIKIISEHSISYFNDLLKKWDISSDEEWIKTWLEPNLENYQNWIITWYWEYYLKFRFFFPEYQVATYSDWIQSIDFTLNMTR